MKANRTTPTLWKTCGSMVSGTVLSCILAAPLALGQATNGPVRITLDEAIQMALQHNHNLLAMTTTIQQSQSEEITQNLRPNPTLFADWEYLPLGAPSHQNPNLYGGESTGQYLHDNTEGDIGVTELPGGAYATMVHKGPYVTLGGAYQALFGGWLPASGRELRDDPCLEAYLNSPQNTRPEDLLTAIHVPLA